MVHTNDISAHRTQGVALTGWGTSSSASSSLSTVGRDTPFLPRPGAGVLGRTTSTPAVELRLLEAAGALSRVVFFVPFFSTSFAFPFPLTRFSASSSAAFNGANQFPGLGALILAARTDPRGPASTGGSHSSTGFDLFHLL